MAMGNVVENTRPKVLEDAAALSMVALVVDRATANSTDTTKGEEQSTSDVRWSVNSGHDAYRCWFRGIRCLSFSFSISSRAKVTDNVMKSKCNEK